MGQSVLRNLTSWVVTAVGTMMVLTVMVSNAVNPDAEPFVPSPIPVEPKRTGVIIKWEKNERDDSFYGIIAIANVGQVYMHQDGLNNREDAKSIVPGHQVYFLMIREKKPRVGKCKFRA